MFSPTSYPRLLSLLLLCVSISAESAVPSILPSMTNLPTLPAIPVQIPQTPTPPAVSTPTPVVNTPIVSDAFGANLFMGGFAKQGVTQFNPNYAVNIGDTIALKLWGAFELDTLLTVDPKGNIFIPHAGTVHLLGVRNQDIQKLVESAIAKVFKKNVNSYASLATAQPVRVLLGGFVKQPGIYNGSSMDSLLHYLDQAGGIDPERGSFLNIQVKRGEQVRATVNLYEFLLKGQLPQVQLADGDVIFVSARQNTIKVTGLVENANRFEFNHPDLPLQQLLSLARPLPSATHLRVTRNTGSIKSTDYYAIAEPLQTITLHNGDDIEFTADKKPGTISVRVEGEHLSPQEYILPYGSHMGDLLAQIAYSERSDRHSLQLFRQSIKIRQKTLLQTSLKSLETAALTARSGTSDEARLRADEANLILQWVERAKNIEPTGQVVMANARGRDQLLLENGDIIRVPSKDGLVLISGEVLFPNAVAFDQGLSANDYIQLAGGYTQNADSARVIVAHRDGRFANLTEQEESIQMGDEILVLPKIDVKSTQITKDLTQILYQIAVSAKVVLGL